MRWSDKELLRLVDLLNDDRPLYVFIDDHEKVLGAEWFASHAEALQHARSFDTPVVNILIHIGFAENKNESFYIEKPRS